MANVDGYYFLIGKKTLGDDGGIHSEIGKNSVAYYKNFKAGGKNDAETPDAIVDAIIYPFTKNDPQTEVTINDLPLSDDLKLSFTIELKVQEVGAKAGTASSNFDGQSIKNYIVYKDDERVFFVDSDGFQNRIINHCN